MTVVGAGGVRISKWQKGRRFHRDYDKLTIELRDLTDIALQDLVKDPRPSCLRFEKLKGWEGIYTAHITGNYKMSMELHDGSCAYLRRVANHDEIDRQS
jgi:hypothetical protein